MEGIRSKLQSLQSALESKEQSGSAGLVDVQVIWRLCVCLCVCMCACISACVVWVYVCMCIWCMLPLFALHVESFLLHLHMGINMSNFK